MKFKQALAEAARQGPAKTAEVITLNEYIDRVAQRPTIAATAHQRIYDMIMASGFTDGLHAGEVSYNFFSAELFGLDVPLERVVRYFETAAQGHETRRRICCSGALRAARRAPSPRCSSAGWRNGRPPRTAPSMPSRAARCTRSRCT